VLAYTGEVAPLAASDGTTIKLPTLTDLGVPVLVGLQPASKDGSEAKRVLLKEAERTWTVSVLPLPTLRGVLSLGIVVPIDELLAGAYSIRDRGLLAALGVLLLVLPLTWWVATSIAHTLRDVTREARDQAQLDRVRQVPPPFSSDRLSGAIARMRDTIRRFLDLSHRHAERDFPKLLQVSRATASITGPATSGLSWTRCQRLPGGPGSSAGREAPLPEVAIDVRAPPPRSPAWKRTTVE
jgi:hypothetical protein